MTNIVLILIAVVVIFFGYRYLSGNTEAAAENARIGQEFLSSNADQEGVTSTSSGLQFKVLQAGDGNAHPKPDDKVKVHYHGTLIDGSVFDSSVDRGEPITFGLKQVIPGWTEGLQTMVVGEKTRLFIPSKLGYGNRSAGSIPAGSLLIFDVELIAINP